MKILVLLIVALLSLTSFFIPWLAPALYHLASLLQPQALWPWRFNGIPIFKIFAGLTLLIACYQLFTSKAQASIYRSGFTYAMVALFVARNASHRLSPFGAPDPGDQYFINIITDTTNTIFIMYMATLAILNEERHLKIMSGLLIGVACYFVYWANLPYIQQEWYRFHQGRLIGLYDSQYADGNVLSVLLVIGYPFLAIKYFHTKELIPKACLAIAVLMLWHALFLFGSRGALIALVVTSAFLYKHITSKLTKILLVTGFTAAVLTQGGAMLERSTETVGASQQDTGEPLNPRLVSWQVGGDLFLNYPLLGVGPGRFLIASTTLYPGRSPHVAHNTLISLAAESGLFAAIAFIVLLVGAWKVHKLISSNRTIISDDVVQISQASIAAIAGFAVCSVFLDLTIFEPLYFLIIMIQIQQHCAIKSINNHQIWLRKTNSKGNRNERPTL